MPQEAIGWGWKGQISIENYRGIARFLRRILQERRIVYTRKWGKCPVPTESRVTSIFTLSDKDTKQKGVVEVGIGLGPNLLTAQTGDTVDLRVERTVTIRYERNPEAFVSFQLRNNRGKRAAV